MMKPSGMLGNAVPVATVAVAVAVNEVESGARDTTVIGKDAEAFVKLAGAVRALQMSICAVMLDVSDKETPVSVPRAVSNFRTVKPPVNGTGCGEMVDEYSTKEALAVMLPSATIAATTAVLIFIKGSTRRPAARQRGMLAEISDPNGPCGAPRVLDGSSQGRCTIAI